MKTFLHEPCHINDSMHMKVNLNCFLFHVDVSPCRTLELLKNIEFFQIFLPLQILCHCAYCGGSEQLCCHLLILSMEHFIRLNKFSKISSAGKVKQTDSVDCSTAEVSKLRPDVRERHVPFFVQLGTAECRCDGGSRLRSRRDCRGSLSEFPQAKYGKG